MHNGHPLIASIKFPIIMLIVALGVALGVAPSSNSVANEPGKAASAASAHSADKAVKQAQRTIRMLDDLYKTTIVLVTDTYVEDESSTPAISAAMALWKTMDKNGWHKVRLIDATGDPYESDNVAKSDFEKQAIKKLTTETPYLDTVVTENGKRYLEALTQVPVVMDKCVLCHANYEDLPKGKTIGAVSYRILIDE